jgi:hypothetical protein
VNFKAGNVAEKTSISPSGGMIGHKMTPAFGAILPLTDRSFLVGAQVFRAFGDVHRIRLPQTESIDRPAGP